MLRCSKYSIITMIFINVEHFPEVAAKLCYSRMAQWILGREILVSILGYVRFRHFLGCALWLGLPRGPSAAARTGSLSGLKFNAAFASNTDWLPPFLECSVARLCSYECLVRMRYNNFYSLYSYSESYGHIIIFYWLNFQLLVYKVWSLDECWVALNRATIINNIG